MSACKGCGAPLAPNRAPGRARIWCSERCRKAQYNRPCIDCGNPVNGSDGCGPNAPLRCMNCAHAAVTIWTPETVIAAIRRWAEEHNGVAPSSSEWNATHCRQFGYPQRDSIYPPTARVAVVCGSWAAALTAAGFADQIYARRSKAKAAA